MDCGLTRVPTSVWSPQKERARATSGAWSDGNMILGADRREYEPSDEELLEGEIGSRLARAAAAAGAAKFEAAAKAAGLGPGELTYRTFEFRHVDVMGSGRFFYASAPAEKRLTVGGR